MNTDHVKGALNDAAGRAKRQAGEWTGDEKAQVEGAVQQIKGKAQKAWGDVKDAARDASKDLKDKNERARERSEEETDEEPIIPPRPVLHPRPDR
jgi:uncharacterized protein YjbJ (UPF0337 family)